MSSAAPLLLSPKEVNLLQQSPTPISILDATWFMPNVARDAKDEFLSKRIPGAQFLDLDDVASSHELGLKHMMPDQKTFSQACEKLGVTPSSHVVLYDTHGVFSSPRALFMFRSFGHQNSSVINGGLPRWVHEGLPIESNSPTMIPSSHYAPPHFDVRSIRDYQQIVENSSLDPQTNPDAEIVLDARAHGRYLGTVPEPRPGLSSGHIPNSFSLPFNLFLQKQGTPDGEYTTFLPEQELRAALDNVAGVQYAEKIISGERPVVTSCGSGMTAGVLWLGLSLLGAKNIGLYDESWTGYAMRPSSKIVKTDRKSVV